VAWNPESIHLAVVAANSIMSGMSMETSDGAPIDTATSTGDLGAVSAATDAHAGIESGSSDALSLRPSSMA